MPVDKNHQWSEEKNSWLKEHRGVSFEQVMAILIDQQELDILEHTKEKYKHQKIYIVLIEGYVYLVPFVEDDEKVFLKTIIPSRKAMKQYVKNSQDSK